MDKLQILDTIRGLPSFLRKRDISRNEPDSVFFFTFHKCASSLFSSFVLKNLSGLTHVDYSQRIYSGNMEVSGALDFRKKGVVYGPVRLSSDRTSPDYAPLIARTSEPTFINDRIALILVRDPRDILVSSYFSFAFSHSFSRVPEIRKKQEAYREKLLKTTVDEYVLESADNIRGHFEAAGRVHSACERSVVLKYEDLIDRFEFFISEFQRWVALDSDVVQEIHSRSRPRVQEDRTSHRRSGTTGEFRNKLESVTVRQLNRKLSDTLRTFGYQE